MSHSKCLFDLVLFLKASIHFHRRSGTCGPASWTQHRHAAAGSPAVWSSAHQRPGAADTQQDAGLRPPPSPRSAAVSPAHLLTTIPTQPQLQQHRQLAVYLVLSRFEAQQWIWTWCSVTRLWGASLQTRAFTAQSVIRAMSATWLWPWFSTTLSGFILVFLFSGVCCWSSGSQNPQNPLGLSLQKHVHQEKQTNPNNKESYCLKL